MRTINHIVIHCTASHQNLTLSQLLQEFKDRGWKTPGYHFVIFPNGNVENIVKIDKIANGVANHNANSIHISYVGGIDEKGKSKDTRTSEQLKSMENIVRTLHKQFPSAKIVGHRDFSPDTNHNGIIDAWERIKECPSFEVADWLKSIKLD